MIRRKRGKNGAIFNLSRRYRLYLFYNSIQFSFYFYFLFFSVFVLFTLTFPFDLLCFFFSSFSCIVIATSSNFLAIDWCMCAVYFEDISPRKELFFFFVMKIEEYCITMPSFQKSLYPGCNLKYFRGFDASDLRTFETFNLRLKPAKLRIFKTSNLTA